MSKISNAELPLPGTAQLEFDDKGKARKFFWFFPGKGGHTNTRKFF